MRTIEDIKIKLHGPIFSIITPFKKNEEIDYSNLRNYIRYLYKRGAKVFYVMVYNSRLGLLSEDEIIKLNVFCIKEVKKLSKNNIIICAEPYHSSTIQTLKYCNYFKKRGADIVSIIFGEKFYNNDQVYNHFKTIHNKTKCFLLLHQQVLENGISNNPPYLFYNIELLKKILSLPRIIAMKEDSKNNILTKKICKKFSKKTVIITSGGGKRQWLYASKYGCQSWLSGVSNLDPKIAYDFYNAHKIGNKNLIKLIIDLIEKPFFRIKKRYGWHLTIKSFLEVNNNFPRFERKPLLELNNDDHNKIKKIFSEIRKKSKKLKLDNYFNISHD